MEIKKRTRTRQIFDDGELITEKVESGNYIAIADWEDSGLMWLDVYEAAAWQADSNPLNPRRSIAGKVKDKWDFRGFSGVYTTEEMRGIFSELLDFLEYLDDHLDMEKGELTGDENVPTEEITRDKRGR